MKEIVRFDLIKICITYCEKWLLDLIRCWIYAFEVTAKGWHSLRDPTAFYETKQVSKFENLILNPVLFQRSSPI